MSNGLYITRQGHGEPVTLIHGWGMNSAIFEPVLPLLSETFEVIRVDLPGHGRSSELQGHNLDQQLDILAEALPPSTLAGWSMGGLLALGLVQRWPEKFSRLVLLSSNPCFVQRTGWSCAVERKVFEEFSSALIADWQVTIKRFIGLQLHGIPQARDLIRQVAGLLVKGGRPDPQALRFGLKLLLEFDARAELATIQQPVMAILGARDQLVPKCLAREFPLINPQIRVECLAQSAHAPFVSHPESIAQLLRGFIKPASFG